MLILLLSSVCILISTTCWSCSLLITLFNYSSLTATSAIRTTGLFLKKTTRWSILRLWNRYCIYWVYQGFCIIINMSPWRNINRLSLTKRCSSFNWLRTKLVGWRMRNTLGWYWYNRRDNWRANFRFRLLLFTFVSSVLFCTASSSRVIIFILFF